MDGVATVVLGLEEAEVTEEVMHFLDRSGGARVVATAGDRRQLGEAIRQLEPDAVIASPTLATGTGLGTSVFLALDTAESVRGLRAAISAGARGFYIWPGDRDALAGATSRLATDGIARRPSHAGSVWTVFGPRGGAGTTFVACHLAAALGQRDEGPVVLVDMDLAFADCTHALGVSDAGARTIGDLVPVLGELRARHFDEVLIEHAGGFRALLAPGQSSSSEGEGRLDAEGASALLAGLRGIADRVIVHVPRGLEPVTRAALVGASRVAMVMHPDALSLRAARRALDVTRVAERTVAVITATRRGEVGVSDVERVLGCPVVVVPADPAAPAAQDRGQLVSLRGRTGRALRSLAEAMEARV